MKRKVYLVWAQDSYYEFDVALITASLGKAEQFIEENSKHEAYWIEERELEFEKELDWGY